MENAQEAIKITLGLDKYMTISQELIDILACPKCKEKVELNEAGDGLVCGACKLVYEIRDGIPVMLAEEAKPLS